MSDYLYNILVRSFRLVETAEPRLSSVFEPSSDFRPIDALENYSPTEGRPPALHESERTSHASSARPPEEDAPAQRAQRAARSDSPTSANVSPSARPLIEGPAAGDAKAGRDANAKLTEAARDPSARSQAIIHLESQTQPTPAPVIQTSRQGETQPRAQPVPVPSASITNDAPTVAGVMHDSTVDRTARTQERAAEPWPKGEEKISLVSSDRQSQAETKSRIHGAARHIPGIEERTRLIERVTEQTIVESAASQESQPPSLKKESIAARQPPHDLSQRAKVTASEGVAALSRPPQQRHASILPVVTKFGDERPHETVINQSQITRRVEIERPESTTPKARAPVPEQIVQVTIGRIDVRASSPPAAQAKAQQKTARRPSQSLEEYLRQRGQQGGGSGR